MDQRQYTKQIIGINYQGAMLGDRLKANLFYKRYSVHARLTETNLKIAPNGVRTLTSRLHDSRLSHDGYGAALSYTLNPKLVLLLSGEQAVRLPSSTELLGNASNNINASLNLRPERSLNMNIGVNVGPYRLGAHELSADVNLFYRRITDMIQRGVPRSNDDFYAFENLGSIISRGVDAELRYRWSDRLSLSANGSYFDARFNQEYDPMSGLRIAHYMRRLRNAPYLTGNLNAEYIVGRVLARDSRLALTYNFGYTHEFYIDWDVYGDVGKVSVPTQAVHDLGLTYTFSKRRFTLALDAKNIFDQQVFDNYALQKPGRSLHAKLTFRIF